MCINSTVNVDDPFFILHECLVTAASLCHAFQRRSPLTTPELSHKNSVTFQQSVPERPEPA